MGDVKQVLVPRNDFVLIRKVVREKLGGVYVPGISLEGSQYFVESVGPDVKDLSVGDQVICTGQKNVDFSDVPGHPGLIIIREGNVVVRFAAESESLPELDESAQCIKEMTA